VKDWSDLIVLVTGGTGSFGKKFTEIMLREYHPRKLIIFSRDELKQHEMRMGGFNHPSLRYFIGDVRDCDRLRRAMNGVDLVVHAAALKQVPACEYNPFEAIKTNILGAKNVIDAAIDRGVRKVMALSTDKAVNPINLYGASKLCAEKLFVQGNSYSGEGGTLFSCVRYGNVVGSRGSVIPVFQQQRREGKITITDERMTRFWITLEQGVAFVIRCIGKMQGGGVFEPKIPSMSMIDLAEAVAPGCEMEFVGIRPGEKLHEVLVSRDESRYTLDLGDMFVIQPVHPWWQRHERPMAERGGLARDDRGVTMASRLAVEGGSPVRQKYLPYGHQWIDEDDIAAVSQVLRSDWVTTGPGVDEFEARLAEYVGSEYAVVLSSGTAALHAAAFAAGIGPGDEVITTPLTFAASANCVLYQGGAPRFADVEADTLNIDPVEIERAITPRTKAIIPVDYTGQPCDLAEISEIARQHDLVVIEDAAHALGAEYRGQRVGSLSHMTVFSFHPVKLITTGEGGAVTTDDAELARRLRLFRNHGITSEARERQEAGAWFYEMTALGFNYRLTDFQCALGMSQLDKLDRFLARRREIAREYDEAFADLAQVMTPAVRDDRLSAWHLYVIRLALERLRVGRGEVFAALRAENIGVNVHYIPVYWHPYYAQLGYERGLCPVAEDAYERLVTLPLFPAMSDADVADVIAAVHKVMEAYAL